MFARIAPLAALLVACTSEPLEIHRWSSGADGFDTHSYWVDDGEQVIVFDAQFTPDLAEQLLADIQSQTETPIGAVVVTHPNPDKFLGAPVFQDAGAELIASSATAAAIPGVWAYKKAYFVGAGMFTEESFPAEPTVDQTFDGELSLGDLTLVELERAGVTTTQTVAVVGEDLIVGDLVAGRAHAWLEGGIVDGVATPDLDGWRAALDELPALGSGDLYPGRGETLAVQTAVDEQVAYLDGMETVVRDYLGGLEDPAAALSGDEAGAHYAAITADAEAAYPQHTLSYLVTYGVYGLAWQIVGE